MNTRELREQRSGLIAKAREILDAAETGNRGLTAEEQAGYDSLFGEANLLGERVQRLERQAEVEHELTQSRGASVHTQQAVGAGQQNDSERRYQNFCKALPCWITADWRGMPQTEVRALQQDLDVSGGYLVAPEQFVQQVLKAVDDQVYMRQWATTMQVPNADSLGVATIDTNPSDADWTSELLIGTADTAMTLGKRELHPKPLAKYILLSRKLLRSRPDASTMVRDALAYKFGITFEQACLTGSGANGPLGVLTASAQGISTARDVSTGNTATSITFDGLISAKYTLKGKYHPNARWLFSTEAMAQIAKLKDGEGQYLWRESTRVTEPDRILGIPVFMSEYVSHVFTTGLYVGILGDFRQYWIADALTLEFQTLTELFAATNQIAVVGRLESDGLPVLEEAFVRVTLG